MQSLDTVNRLLDYIDEHITQELTALALAKKAGYSFYHFCHLFKSCTGYSIGSYLRRRRLEFAAAELPNGGSITEIACKYGFDTPAGFNKAFKKRYNLSPSEYKALKGGLPMTPTIKKMTAFTAIGYSLTPPGDNIDPLDSSAYWLGKDFSAVSGEDYAKLCVPNNGEIGAWMHPDEVSGDFYYFFGPIVGDKSFVPAGLSILEVPEADYAVFAVPKAENPKDLSVNIRNTMKNIFADWLDSSGYSLAQDKVIFEYYMEEDTFIYVPVK